MNSLRAILRSCVRSWQCDLHILEALVRCWCVKVKFLLIRVGYDAWKLEAGRHNLFSMRDEAAHTRLRSKMTAGVSPDSFVV